MRITAGLYKGRKLEVSKGNEIRPTSDKVRQAIFNSLNARDLIQDSIVIDAFCGTGALGLESLSRGSAHCVFFDKNKSSFDICRSNVTALGADGNSTVILKDVTKVKKKPEDIRPTTLVFLDPPYQRNLIIPALEALKEGQWLNTTCYLVIETEKSESLHSLLFEIMDEKIYGDTKISFGKML